MGVAIHAAYDSALRYVDLLPRDVRHQLAPGHAQLRVLIVNEDLRSAASLKQTMLELGYCAGAAGAAATISQPIAIDSVLHRTDCERSRA